MIMRARLTSIAALAAAILFAGCTSIVDQRIKIRPFVFPMLLTAGTPRNNGGQYEIGEPVYLDMRLYWNERKPLRIGMDGVSLEDSSWRLEVAYESGPYKAIERYQPEMKSPLCPPERRFTVVTMPDNRYGTSLRSVVEVRTAAAPAAGIDRSPPLIFNKPGHYGVRVRFLKLSDDPDAALAAIRAGKEPHWRELVTNPVGIEITK